MHENAVELRLKSFIENTWPQNGDSIISIVAMSFKAFQENDSGNAWV